MPFAFPVWMVMSMLVLPLIFVGLMVWALMINSGQNVVATVVPSPRPGDSAIKVARLRFARGDISYEEYARLVAALKN